MSEALARGYTIERAWSFIETHFDAATGARLLEGLPPETLALRSEIKPANWYPRSHLVNVFRCLAKVGGSDDALFGKFVDCGMFMSTEATNTYLRVLMKLLTPGLLAKKLPSFWDRDFKGGQVETDPSKLGENLLTIRIRDVGGFEHAAGVSVGYVRFVLEAMGKQDVRYSQTGWSAANPGPEKFQLDIRWA